MVQRSEGYGVFLPEGYGVFLPGVGQGQWLEGGSGGCSDMSSFPTGQADPAHQGPHGVRGETVCQGAADPAADATQEDQVWGPGECPGRLDSRWAWPGAPGAQD